MKSIYQTKRYKIILSYSTFVKAYKHKHFTKSITFYVEEYNGAKEDYYIIVKLFYDKTNKTIYTSYIVSADISSEKRAIINDIKYDYVFINNMYSDLFENINNRDYINSVIR